MVARTCASESVYSAAAPDMNWRAGSTAERPGAFWNHASFCSSGVLR
jgi:hypothetical protein